MNRVILIVMDGCGAGEAPDAARFGDRDHPATLLHVKQACPNLNTPTLNAIGLFTSAGDGQVPAGLEGFSIQYGRLQPLSEGKDSVTGHWEMMDIITKVPFPTYPNGFPTDLIQAFESEIGRTVLGNKPASGTVIIEELGDQHVQTGSPIVYTSADSVFQIAAHESVIPIDLLYRYCQAARKLCVSPNNVERVIARPFIGESGNYVRTGNRRDFPLEPPHNLIDDLVAVDHRLVEGVGVVPELFNHRGFADHPRSKNNGEHFAALQQAMKTESRFIFANFEDFDMLYGHRSNPAGFGTALEQFDIDLHSILQLVNDGDLLMLTADHGNDPTTPSTDHSREYVPWITIKKSLEGGILSCPDLLGMNQIASTIRHHLGI